MIWVLHLNSIALFKWPSTINVINFAIPSFTWINMYGIINWQWNNLFFKCAFVSWFRILSQYDVSIVFFSMFWYGNAIPLQVSKDMLQNPKDFWDTLQGVLHVYWILQTKWIINIIQSFSFGHEQYPSNSVNPWCLIIKYH
jgi:hypothetical protein